MYSWYTIMKQAYRKNQIEPTEAIVVDSIGFIIYEPAQPMLDKHENDMIAYQEYISDNYGMGYKYE